MPKKSKYYFDGEYYRAKVKKGATAKDGYKTLRARTEKELDEKLRREQVVRTRRIAVDAKTTVAEWSALWYFNRKARFSASVRSYYEPMINSVIAPLIGTMLLPEVLPENLEGMLSSTADKSESYQAKLVRLLKGIFGDAVKNGLIVASPAAELKPRGKETVEKDALTNKQRDALFAAVKGTRAELFVALGYYAGLRRQEICGLQWADINMLAAQPSLTINNAVRWPDKKAGELSSVLKSKNAHRTIPVHPELLKALKAAKRSGPFVIAGKGKDPVTYSSMTRIWTIVDDRTLPELLPEYKRQYDGEPKKAPNREKTLDFRVTSHHLRHTFATNLIASGMDIKKVQYLTGHKDINVLLRIYAHVIGNTPEQLAPGVIRAL